MAHIYRPSTLRAALRLRSLPHPTPSSPSSSIHSSSPSSARVLSSSSLSWAELASQISGRERVENRRREFEEKYADRLQQKVKREGARNLEELKTKAEMARAHERRKTEKFAKRALERAKAERVVRSPSPASALPTKSDSPMKPLSQILDVDKLRTEPTPTVTKLWNAYHLSKPDKLSAVIPLPTYQAMISVAKRYPSFVVPLPRKGAVEEAVKEAKDKELRAEEVVEVPLEMQFLEWGFLPPPTTATATATAPPTSVLFTPLGEYKLRQSFAQPTLVLSHYTDLAESHGIVLMRGEVSKDVGGRLEQDEAQLLVFRLQQFFNWGASTAATTESETVQTRRQLLQTFHERPADFDINALVQTTRDV